MARELEFILDDILTAISRIEDATRAMTAAEFESNWRAQYIVQRGLMIVSEASRSIPDGVKARHAEIRWAAARDIGNVLRHAYATLSNMLLWNVV